jgi:hypothetical protein
LAIATANNNARKNTKTARPISTKPFRIGGAPIAFANSLERLIIIIITGNARRPTSGDLSKIFLDPTDTDVQ